MTIATPIEAVNAFNAAWANGDVDAAMLWVAQDAVYALYISGELLPHGGETHGRRQIAGALRQVRADFDYLLYRPLHIFTKDDKVRFQVEFIYRHRLSGEILNGRSRFVMVVRDGLIVRADEYHDRAKVEAFMRLFGGGA